MDQPTISWFFVPSRKGFQEIPPIISVIYIYICTAYRYLFFVSQPQTLCIYRRIFIYAPKMKTRNPSQNEITLGSKEYHDMQSDKVCCWVFTVVGHVCCETCLAQQQSWVQAKYLKSSKFQNPQKKSLYPNLNNFCWIPRFAFSFEIFKKKQVSVSFQSAPKTTNQPTTPEKNFRKKKKNFRVILAHCCNKGGTKSSPRMQLLQLNSLWPPPETNSEWKSVGHIPTIHFQGLKILVSGRVRVVYVSFWSSRKKIRNNCENFGKKVSGQNVMFNKNILGNFWLIPKHGCLKWMDHDGPLQWKSSSCGENFGKFPFPAMVSVDLGCGKHVETPLEPPLLAAPPANLVIFSMFFSRITPKSSLHG